MAGRALARLPAGAAEGAAAAIRALTETATHPLFGIVLGTLLARHAR